MATNQIVGIHKKCYCFISAPSKFATGQTELKPNMSSPFRRPKGRGGTKTGIGHEEGAYTVRKCQFGDSRSNAITENYNGRLVEVWAKF